MLTPGRVLLVASGATAVCLCGTGFVHIALAQAETTTPKAASFRTHDATGPITSLTDSAQAMTVSPVVAAGWASAFLIEPDGSLWSWGNNTRGQLGDGAHVSRSQPAQVTNITALKTISSNYMQAFGIDPSGALWAWGYNNDGEIGNGTTSSDVTPPVQVLTQVQAVALGQIHSLALRSDGTVWAWGNNDFGSLGDGTTTKRLSPQQVPGLGGVVGIAANGLASFAVLSDGSVRTWGEEWAYQSGLRGPINYTPTPVSGLAGVTAMAVAYTTVFALESDGSVWAFGDGYYGLNGDGTTTVRTSPGRVPGLPPIKSIASGYTHVLALDFDGTVWAWGSNAYGELGDGTTTQRASPIQIPGLSDVVSIAGGLYDSLAVTSSGTVYTWGFNSYGQLGNGLPTSPPVLSPTAISGSNYDWSVQTPQLSLPGGTYTTALNVTVSCATSGATIYYTLDGSTPTTASPTVASGGTVAITQSETLKANAAKSGLPTSSTAVAVYTLQAIAPSASPVSGTFTTAQNVTLSDATPGVAIRYTLDGSTPSSASPVYSTPINISTQTTLQAYASKAGWTDSDVFSATYSFNFGSLAAPTASPTAGTYISSVTVTLSGPAGATIRYTTDGSTPTVASPAYTGPIALTQTTTLNAASFRTDYATSPVTSLLYTVKVATPVLSKASGTYPAGTTVTVTEDTAGATLHYTLDGTDPTTTSPTIVSGATLVIGNYTLKAKATKTGCTDSDIASASYSESGTLPVALAASGYAAMLSSDGTVWFWGGNTHPSPTTVPQFTGVKAIATGGAFVLALKLDGTVWSLGGPTQNNEVVSQVSGLSSIIAIAAGLSHALALRSDGTVWAWGYNYFGQLGQDTALLLSTTPLQVTGLINVTQIAASYNSSFALIGSKAWAWGDNQFGELGDGTVIQHWTPAPAAAALSSITQLEAGGSSALALTADGKLWGWGGNSSGQLGDGTLVNRPQPLPILLPAIRTMAMGNRHALALDQAGAVWAWGDNSVGELGDNSVSDGLSPIQVLSLPSTVIAIAAGNDCSLAATAGGTVWAWGSNIAFCGGDGTRVQRNAPEQISSDGPSWRLQPPTLTPPPGDYNSAVSVSVSGDPSAETHYTLDGTTPTAASPLLAPGAKIQIDAPTTLLVISAKGTTLPSVPIGGRYSLKPATPTATPGAGLYPITLSVQLSTTPSGSTIRYTLDRTDPSATSTLYQDPIPVTSSVQVRARAFKAGWDDSDVLISTYTLQLGTLATPVISPNGGSFQAPTPVTISVPSGTTVRYTLDGTEPTEGSAAYSGNFLISRPATLKAKAFRKDYTPSPTATATFTFTIPPPDFSLSSGTYHAGTTVRVTSPFPGAHILYTVDGRDPVFGAGAVDAPSPATVTLGNFTLKARALLPGVVQSSVVAETFSVTGNLPKSGAQLAFSDTFVLYVSEGGQLASWGLNADGQLGDGTTNTASLPRLVDLPAAVRSVAAGNAFGIVALDDGSVWAWGSNASGQLGDGTTASRYLPGQVTGLTNIVQVAAGDSTAYALGSNGTVWAWGSNAKGQLGSGNTSPSISPRIVTGLAAVQALRAGPTRAVALLQDGTLAQWGSNPTNASQPILVPTKVGGGAFVIVAASDTHTVAAKADGTVYAFGANATGELGVPPSTSSSATPIQVPGVSNASALAAGVGFTWVCNGGGTCWAFGDNAFGQLGVPYAQNGAPVGVSSVPGAEGVTAVAAAGKTAGFPTMSGPRFYGQQPWAGSLTSYAFNPGSVSAILSGPTIPQLLGFPIGQVQFFWWSTPQGSTLSDDHLRLVVTGVDPLVPGSTLAHFPNVVAPAESLAPVGGGTGLTYSAAFRVPYDARGGAYFAVSSRGVPNDFLGELKAAGHLSPPVAFDNIQSVIAVPDNSGGSPGHILVADDTRVWDVDLFARDFSDPASLRDGKYFLSRVSRDGYFFAVERETTDPDIFRAHVSAPGTWEKWASTSPLGSSVIADGIAATEDGTVVYLIDSANQNIISFADKERPQYVWDKDNLPLKPRVFKSPSGLELQNGTLIFLTTDSSQQTYMEQYSVYGFPVWTGIAPTMPGGYSVQGLEADRWLFDAQATHPMRFIYSASVAGALVNNPATGVAGRVFATQDKTRLELGYGTGTGVESGEFGGHRILMSTQPSFGAGYVDGAQLADGLATITVFSPIDVDVYVSALDPPDPAAYVVSSSNDNNAVSPAWGLSMSQDGSGPSTCVQYHSSVSPTNMYGLTDRTVFLRMPLGSAGDNVRVKVGLVPPAGSDCTASGPVRGFSGLYTSWKRLYLEVDRMYRRGGVLAEDAVVGSTAVRVAAARTSEANLTRKYDRGAVDVQKGNTVQIFGWDAAIPGLMQSEVACVGADPSWDEQVATLTLVKCSNPTESYSLQNNYKANYSNSDGEYQFTPTYGISGVAPITAPGGARADVFDFAITGFGNVFADGYVDLYVLPPTPSSPGVLPYVPQGWMSRGDVYLSPTVDHSIVELSNATFGRAQSVGGRDIAAQNLVHLVIAGDGPVSDTNRETVGGLTFKAPYYMTWIFGNEISTSFAPLRFRWVTAHELGHQFSVNVCAKDTGHDVRNGWPSEINLPGLPASSCLMLRTAPKDDDPYAYAYFCREDLLFGDPECPGTGDANHPRPGSIRAAPDPLR